MERLTAALMTAVGAAIDKDETTHLTIDGEPVAVIAPYSLPPFRGVQIGHGNVQSNTFG